MIFDLKQQYNDLEFLLHHYDPNKDLSQDVYFLLKKYHLVHIQDPFMVTNELWRMLDKCEEEMKTKEQSKN